MEHRQSTTAREAALYAAINAGMLREIDGGYDLDQFHRFWADYQEGLADQRLQQAYDLAEMLHQERKERAGDRTYYRRKYRNLLVSALVGALLGSILTILRLAL